MDVYWRSFEIIFCANNVFLVWMSLCSVDSGVPLFAVFGHCLTSISGDVADELK